MVRKSRADVMITVCVLLTNARSEGAITVTTSTPTTSQSMRGCLGIVSDHGWVSSPGHRSFDKYIRFGGHLFTIPHHHCPFSCPRHPPDIYIHSGQCTHGYHVMHRSFIGPSMHCINLTMVRPRLLPNPPLSWFLQRHSIMCSVVGKHPSPLIRSASSLVHYPCQKFVALGHTSSIIRNK